MSGRHIKLTKQVLATLEENLTKYPVKHSAHLSGFSERTYYSYKARAEELENALEESEILECDLTKEDKLFLQFLHVTRVSRTKLEQKLIDSWMQAASQWMSDSGKLMPGDWRAAMSLLARLNPETFADPNVRAAGRVQDDSSDFGVIETPAMPAGSTTGDFMSFAQQQQSFVQSHVTKQQRESDES